MKRTKNFLGVAGCLLAAGSLCAADYTASFENASVSPWTGGELSETTYSYAGITGLPLPNANHAKVLLVEGDVTCTPTGGTFAGKPMVDMMVQAALPDDALETPEEGAHIAVAVDTNGIFNVYCKNKSNEAAWYPLSSTKYADGAWARVSLLFDYANKRCQVRLDGQPMMTANGYLDETTTDTTKSGAWYNLVSTDTTASTAVSNLKVVGCTAVDDVVIAEDKDAYVYATDGAAVSGVPCAWLDQYGLGWNTTATYDNTGMTVAQKYNACLSPFDDQKFEIKSVKATATKTQVGIPATVAVSGRQVVLEYGSTPSSMGNETPVTPGATEVEIDLPEAGAVKYFRLKAKAAQ